MSTLTCVLSPMWPAQQLLLKPSFPACSHPVASSNSPSHFPYSLSPSWAFLLLLVDQTQALLFTLAVPFPPRLRSPIIFLLHLSSFLHGSQYFFLSLFLHAAHMLSSQLQSPRQARVLMKLSCTNLPPRRLLSLTHLYNTLHTGHQPTTAS